MKIDDWWAAPLNMSISTAPDPHPCRDGTKEEIVDLRVRRFDEIVLCGIPPDRPTQPRHQRHSP